MNPTECYVILFFIALGGAALIGAGVGPQPNWFQIIVGSFMLSWGVVCSILNYLDYK